MKEKEGIGVVGEKEKEWNHADERARAGCLNWLWEVRTLSGRATNTVEDIKLANQTYNDQMRPYQTVEPVEVVG